MPVKPPISAAMLVMVARSSTPSASIASPEYSMTLASALPERMYSSDSSFRMKSFAVAFSRFLPRMITFTDSGTFTRTSLVNHALKTSVVPMPKATQPIAPTCGVCESLPTLSWPGSA